MASVGFGVGEIDNNVLDSAAESSLSNGGTISVCVISGVYGISLTLGSLSADEWLCFSVLLVVWCGLSAMGCVGSWVQCIRDWERGLHGDCHQLIFTVDGNSQVSHDPGLIVKGGSGMKIRPDSWPP